MIFSNIVTCSLKNEQQQKNLHQKCFALKMYKLLIKMLWHDSKKHKKSIKKESNENWKTENTRKSNNVNK